MVIFQFCGCVTIYLTRSLLVVIVSLHTRFTPIFFDSWPVLTHCNECVYVNIFGEGLT